MNWVTKKIGKEGMIKQCKNEYSVYKQTYVQFYEYYRDKLNHENLCIKIPYNNSTHLKFEKISFFSFCKLDKIEKVKKKEWWMHLDVTEMKNKR